MKTRSVTCAAQAAALTGVLAVGACTSSAPPSPSTPSGAERAPPAAATNAPGGPPPAAVLPPNAPLVGTTWHWFRTIDPERTWSPAEPGRYTLALGTDGRALVRADCNRGSGTYTLTGTSLQLGPVATTKMLCTDANGLDDRYVRQLGGIRIVAIVAGMLRADLLADSGTMFFVPEADAKFVSYRCDGGRDVHAVYTAGRARVLAGPDALDLPQAISGSGVRYAAGDTVWWTKGEEAFLEKGGKRVLGGCRTVPAGG